jgi:hypothetical protein
MFKSVLIKPTVGDGEAVDFGQVIESMFYYQRVIVRITEFDIGTLCHFDDVGVLEDLLSRTELQVVYDNTRIALGRGSKNTLAITLKEDEGDYDFDYVLFMSAFTHTNDFERSKAFGKKFSKLLKPGKKPYRLIKMINEDIKEGDFLRKIAAVSQTKFSNPEKVIYELEYLNDYQFKIHTNLPPVKAHGNIYPNSSPILHAAEALVNLYLMATASSEIVIPEFEAKFLRIKSEGVMRSVTRSQEEIEHFNHYVFDQSRALREAINSRQVDLKSVLKTLDKAAHYKNWLSKLDNDSNLMREYMRKIEEKSVLESLPSRAIRYYFMTGIGTLIQAATPTEIGIPLTVALTAFDAFFIEKLRKRWKPNQFIDNEFRTLIKAKPM